MVSSLSIKGQGYLSVTIQKPKCVFTDSKSPRGPAGASGWKPLSSVPPPPPAPYNPPFTQEPSFKCRGGVTLRLPTQLRHLHKHLSIEVAYGSEWPGQWVSQFYTCVNACFNVVTENADFV